MLEDFTLAERLMLWSAFQQPHISANGGMAVEKSHPGWPSHSFAVSQNPG